MEKWKKIQQEVKEDIKSAGIDIDPQRLPELFAKTITKETIGNRGICIMGGVGSGKTRRMRFLAQNAGIAMMNAREICAAWTDLKGNEADFQQFIRANELTYSVIPKYYHDLIIDDLGSESELYNSYGTAADVMRDIVIPLRYGIFPKWRTFFTTNLTKNELKQRYGERVYSRLNEMCIMIPLNHSDRRIGNND